jgi:hypothetical protein
MPRNVDSGTTTATSSPRMLSTSAWPQMRYPLRWHTFDEDHGLVVFAVGNDIRDVDGNGPYSVESWTLLQ